MTRTRLRLVTAREPNGRIQRERGPGPTEIKRLRDAALRGLRDPEWGTELGRLYLERALTAEMYAAGKRWRESVAAYHGAIGVFPVRTAALERGRSTPPDPDSEGGREQAVRDRDAAEAFFAAHAALVSAGMVAENAVRRLCEDDQALCGLYELNGAICGLMALAHYYGLTERSK